MLATMCDRCGKPAVPFKKYEAAPTFPYYLCKLKMLPWYGLEEKTIDLCEDCKCEFKKWIKGETKNGLE